MSSVTKSKEQHMLNLSFHFSSCSSETPLFLMTAETLNLNHVLIAFCHFK